MSSEANDREAGRVATFLAASGGTGRTSAVANVAWLLAAAGTRVLIVDGGTEPPRTRDYLAPFYLKEVELPARLGIALALPQAGIESPRPPGASRFLIPGGAGTIDVADSVGDPGGRWDRPTERLDSRALATLRARLRSAGYAYVVVDAPSNPPASVLGTIAWASDLVALFSTPRFTAIAGAAGLGRRLRSSAPAEVDDVDIVAVLTMFDSHFVTRAEHIRSVARAEFSGIVSGNRRDRTGIDVIEVPYEPFEAFDPLLPVLLDAPESRSSLVESYRRLAELVSGRAIVELPVVSESVRARYRRAIGLDDQAEHSRIVIAYDARDRIWADWARDQLESAGAMVRLSLGPSAVDFGESDELLVVVSDHFPASPAREAVDELLAGRIVSAAQLRVGATGMREVPGVRTVVDVVSATQEEARSQLLAHFGLVRPPGEPDDRATRYPLDLPAVAELPSRNPDFIGRGKEIEAVRDSFATGDDRTVVLVAERGVGKSEIAKEYAHRFAADYDLIWWVPAHDQASINTNLAALQARLTEEGQREAVSESRWLIVLDNAAEDLTRLVTPGPRRRHVLVTTGNPVVEGIGLEQFSTQDSVTLLMRQVNGLSPEAAGELAEAVEHLPLALALLSSWLREHATEVTRTGADRSSAVSHAAAELRLHLAASSARDEHTSVAARVVEVVLDKLRETTRGYIAAMLAEMCAFLSPHGVDLRLLRSPGMVAQLVEACEGFADSLRFDPSELDAVLWAGTRGGIFTVYWGRTPSLTMHPLVQSVLRDRMPAEKHAARAAQVRAGLARYAPAAGLAERSEMILRFTELQYHMLTSGAFESTDPAVRRWLVDYANFVYVTGDHGSWEAAVEPLSLLLKIWRVSSSQDDRLRARLATQLANLHRALGQYELALRFDDEALAVQRRSLGPSHPNALVTARGRSADLRGMGRFVQALVEDGATWALFRATFGDDHPQTRMAANNVALGRFLTGDLTGALELEQANYQTRMRLLGPGDPNTWWSLCSWAVYLRETGQYDEALARLRTAQDHVQVLRSPLHPEELRIRWHHAITLRRMGEARQARDRTTRVLRAYRDSVGPTHPDTLACQLSYAADLRATGDPRTSIEMATTAVDAYRMEVGLPEEHPFVALGRLITAVGMRAAGQLDDAASHSRAAIDALSAAMDEKHPWTLAATITHATVLAESGDYETAAEMIHKAHDDCVDVLGEHHPYVSVAARNRESLLRRSMHAWREAEVDVPQI